VTEIVSAGYRLAEAVTKRDARNFYYGIRLLPADKRAALCAVYAVARRIDDIGDGSGSTDDKVARLDVVREQLAALDTVTDPVLAALAEAANRFPIPLPAFAELLDGVTMDLVGTTYATFDDLVPYCRRVAGSVGRLCVGVYGTAPANAQAASAHADSLGIALQQVNILRDVREDLLTGRVYLPKDDLDRFGVTLALGPDGALSDPSGGLAALVQVAAARAAAWFDEGLRLLPLLDRRSAACTAAMAGIYRDLLRRFEAEPTALFSGRMSLSGFQKARVAGRALAGRPS
jgi:15-cis-phytoene synthase